jgi:hypothetical protein
MRVGPIADTGLRHGPRGSNGGRALGWLRAEPHREAAPRPQPAAAGRDPQRRVVPQCELGAAQRQHEVDADLHTDARMRPPVQRGGRDRGHPQIDRALRVHHAARAADDDAELGTRAQHRAKLRTAEDPAPAHGCVAGGERRLGARARGDRRATLEQPARAQLRRERAVLDRTRETDAGVEPRQLGDARDRVRTEPARDRDPTRARRGGGGRRNSDARRRRPALGSRALGRWHRGVGHRGVRDDRGRRRDRDRERIGRDRDEQCGQARERLALARGERLDALAERELEREAVRRRVHLRAGLDATVRREQQPFGERVDLGRRRTRRRRDPVDVRAIGRRRRAERGRDRERGEHPPTRLAARRQPRLSIGT